MKILRTNLIDTQFTGYSVRPFKMAEGAGFSYQCDEVDGADFWKVVAMEYTEQLYPLVEFNFNEKHQADKLAEDLMNRLNDVKFVLKFL